MNSLFVLVDARVALESEEECFALKRLMEMTRVVLISPAGLQGISSELGLSRATLETVMTSPIRVERLRQIL